MDKDDAQVVPGLSVNKSGQATVDASIADVLFELALKLEEVTSLPVDVQHVVAALLLAKRGGQLDPQKPLSSDDPVLKTALAVQLRTLFAIYGGTVGTDD